MRPNQPRHPHRTKLHNTYRWQKLRRKYKAEHPMCECGCGWPSEEVDHKIPGKIRPDLFFVVANLQALRRKCHREKTQRDLEAYGEALGGKRENDFVRVGADGLPLDFDRTGYT